MFDWYFNALVETHHKFSMYEIIAGTNYWTIGFFMEIKFPRTEVGKYTKTQ